MVEETDEAPGQPSPSSVEVDKPSEAEEKSEHTDEKPPAEDQESKEKLLEEIQDGEEHVAEEGANEEQEPKPFSYIEMLDAPRELQQPLNITVDYLKLIAEELGLIKLCWPDLSDVTFEDRTNFPDTYLKNGDKEKLLLLYAENFRRQFCYRYPDRKPLFLACDNECGMQKMVCTTIRPTTMPYSQIASWEECSRFVADHIKYDPLEEPILIVST